MVGINPTPPTEEQLEARRVQNRKLSAEATEMAEEQKRRDAAGGRTDDPIADVASMIKNKPEFANSEAKAEMDADNGEETDDTTDEAQ